MVFALLCGSEAFSLGAPRAGARAVAPRMQISDAEKGWYYGDTHPKSVDAFQPNPNMGGDNDYARRSSLSSGGAVSEEVGPAAQGWYYGDTHPKSVDAFQPNPNMGGDNDYARRSSLSAPGRGTVVPTNDAASEWYYAETHKRMKDQFEPAFGDNTYSNRNSL